MRQVLNFNSKWSFTKTTFETLPTEITTDVFEEVNIPHSWNATDGQDGGNDYHRGTCLYAKKLLKADLPVADEYYLEINGANSSAIVYFNGKKLASHDGGYSTWRVNFTNEIEEENLIIIAVDNSPNQRVYPQVADFTFYGGIYRNLNIIAVAKSHFDLDYFGGKGIMVTPVIDGANATINTQTWVTNKTDALKVKYVITDAENKVVASEVAGLNSSLVIENVHLWNGKKDPYLYTLTATLLDVDAEIDVVSTRFGCRTYKVDPDNGFILNGEEYPLRGVSRHQDRLGLGNALLPEHHEEDIALILEVGATTIRLAHYQHDQYFYDLCDEKGLVIWAEIPYISQHMEGGRENTISQMKELIVQNYNHPSIVCWGLSNEITMKGEKDPDLLENHRILNDLVHEMDKTRLTTIAAVSPCPIDCDYIKIPDLVSYNHYFGWYGGDTDMNGPWFDKFHATHPNIPIGCSEYGCEALNWHTSDPVQGDYTEEYQAYYHEELIKQLFTRKYMWATHDWIMFDFGADARSEGGENGQNHKGLITFDRKYKKDSFYAYKAWLSDEKFVHLCGKRYVDRVEDVTKITVYSNMEEVELFANGVSVGKKKAEDHFFYFDVKNEGTTNLKAVAGEYSDESVINKVDVFNEEYRLKENNAIINWFEIDMPEGRLSINDKMSVILSTLRGKLIMLGLVAKHMPKDKKKNKTAMGGFEMNDSMMSMLGGFTFLRLTGMIGMIGINLTREDLIKVNKKLNKIKRPKEKKAKK